jgi:hypothetical protein
MKKILEKSYITFTITHTKSENLWYFHHEVCHHGLKATGCLKSIFGAVCIAYIGVVCILLFRKSFILLLKSSFISEYWLEVNNSQHHIFCLDCFSGIGEDSQ